MDHLRGLKRKPLPRIQIAPVREDDLRFRKGLQRQSFHHGLLAASHQHRQGHPSQESAGGGLPGIEIAVGVKPDQERVDSGSPEPSGHANGSAAVTGDADRAFPLQDRTGDLLRKSFGWFVLIMAGVILGQEVHAGVGIAVMIATGIAGGISFACSRLDTCPLRRVVTTSMVSAGAA